MKRPRESLSVGAALLLAAACAHAPKTTAPGAISAGVTEALSRLGVKDVGRQPDNTDVVCVTRKGLPDLTADMGEHRAFFASAESFGEMVVTEEKDGSVKYESVKPIKRAVRLARAANDDDTHTVCAQAFPPEVLPPSGTYYLPDDGYTAALKELGATHEGTQPDGTEVRCREPVKNLNLTRDVVSMEVRAGMLGREAGKTLRAAMTDVSRTEMSTSAGSGTGVGIDQFSNPFQIGNVTLHCAKGGKIEMLPAPDPSPSPSPSFPLSPPPSLPPSPPPPSLFPTAEAPS